MKLRNKKTGEIKNAVDIDMYTDSVYLKVSTGEFDNETIEYHSLAELNAEWEDYEETEEYYCIDWTEPGIYRTTYEGEWDDFNKEIGNYFDTREEAEQAVEKLKAWKLLKDECNIKFDGIIRDERAMLKGVKLKYDRHQVTLDRMRECMNALHLLFGGEE